jgi:hypothetical protein
MANVLAEAYELVEQELMSEADFRDFVFGNAARLYGSTNPNFFKGTRIEADVAKLLQQG